MLEFVIVWCSPASAEEPGKESVCWLYYFRISATWVIDGSAGQYQHIEAAALSLPYEH
jgi:hypothetical protein